MTDEEAYCQPCYSPVWDTGLVCHALLEVGGERALAQVDKSLEWLREKQILDVNGDWAEQRPGLRPGGWAFQYNNPHYPDVDDTAVVAMAMDRAQNLQGRTRYRRADRARARMDPRHADARTAAGVLSMPTTPTTISTTFRSRTMARCSIRRPRTSARAACRCSRSSATCRTRTSEQPRRSTICGSTQHPEGSWYGRWGMNYIYGTWSVLSALNAAGVDHKSPEVRKAVTGS